MIKQTILIPELMFLIVEKAWEKISDELSDLKNEELDLFFVHGTPRHISERLLRRSNSPTHKNKRFPMVALVHNYEEDYGTAHYYTEVSNLTLWIMHLTSKDADYEKRYQENFKPYLYPIWKSIINTIGKSRDFLIDPSKGVEHKKIDRPNWGSYSAAIGNVSHELGERIDGIELKLNLKLNNKTCIQTLTKNKIILK